eukprot:Blabericola_migrator_1__1216@NODE_1310_length_4840_cov_138_493400_g882_i0_p6_GENE_NODE_1310_length_4840_cov_138_493400_g882_i0NODE_1310_length_4840_cov_138_493400_g882_i0_p6_ORF_typecomplete_len127_score19_69_NODE_1310_length_4840_cov_138_493400_g882_i026613041
MASRSPRTDVGSHNRPLAKLSSRLDSKLESQGSGIRTQVSKVTGMSLAAGLHNGFIELVDALDTLAKVLGSVHDDDSEENKPLREKTKGLLATKGTQAVYWMQLMREISWFATDKLFKLASVREAR